jgi:hypothetical protein
LNLKPKTKINILVSGVIDAEFLSMRINIYLEAVSFRPRASVFLYHVMLGLGVPTAWHPRVVTVPNSPNVSGLRLMVKVGFSIKRKCNKFRVNQSNQILVLYFNLIYLAL